MALQILTMEDSRRWDEIVRSFSRHDVYKLSGYVNGFRLHGDGEPLLFYWESPALRGINVVMRRDIARAPQLVGRLPENTLFDLATPYGYGGWILEGSGGNPSLMFEEYEHWCREHRIISEFVRFHPVLKNYRESEGHYEVIALGNTIAVDLTDREAVWENLTSKNRNMVRKAKKAGLVVESETSAELYETFREIYNATMDKDEAAPYYYFSPEFYASIREDMAGQARVFYARAEDGTIAAASILLAEGERLSYHLSGSRRELQHLAPTNLLLYEAALWGHDQGCKTLHLGGGVGSGEDSLYRFKKAFYRGEPMRFHIGKKIFLPKEYEELVALRATLPESGFFPRYRA